MISLPIARAFVAHLSTLHHTAVVHYDDPKREFASTLLDGLARLNPILRTLADQIAVRTAHTSVTLPTPVGALIILSPMTSDPLQCAETGAHEHQHAVQFSDTSMLQAIIDYVEPELRAKMEADGYAVGLALKWFLTGVLPTLDDAMDSLSREAYLLTADELPLCRGILESHLATMRAGLCPPLTVAIEALAWFRAEHPELVLAEVA